MSSSGAYAATPELVKPSIPSLVRHIAVPHTAVMFTALVTLAVVLQSMAGAEKAGFGGAPDEAAHFVTALMIRDYVAEGMPVPPVTYAERYYVHYPKVAFGIWPPLFHFTAALWLLVFGPSGTSALIFVAAVAAFFALCIYLLGRKLFNPLTGALAAVWFLVLPAVQASASMFMMDMLCAALMMLAAVAFGRYLDTGGARYSHLFGLFAAAAVMTKYNAFALALLPPIAVVLTRKYAVLRTLSFWSSAVIVTALCGWWYVVQADLIWYASQPYSTLAEAPIAAAGNTIGLASTLSWLFFPLVCLGCWAQVARSADPDNRGTWAALLALLVSVWMFHSVLYPTSEARYLLPAIAPIVLFGCAGANVLLSRVPQRLRAATVVLLGLAYLVPSFDTPPKPDRGFKTIADALVDQGLSSDSALLVSSDAAGEGAFVAAVAVRDHRPNAIVLRASKLLASSTWMGADYRLLYPGTAELLDVLDRSRVSHVLVENAAPESLPHEEQLRLVLRASPRWREAAINGSPNSSGLTLYERVAALSPGRPAIQLDMTYSLGRRLVY